jgi:hypothetical protein
MEYFGTLMQELEAKGVDITDPAKLKYGIATYGKDADKTAITRANTIAAVESALPVAGKAAGALAGRVGSKVAQKPLQAIGKGLSYEPVAGPLGGATGELAAQIASGQEIDPQAIALEAGGEGAATVAAIAKAIKGEKKTTDKVLGKIRQQEKIAQAMEEAVKANPEAEGQIRAQYQKPINEAAPTDEEVLSSYESLSALPETEEKNAIRENLEAYMAEKGIAPEAEVVSAEEATAPEAITEEDLAEEVPFEELPPVTEEAPADLMAAAERYEQAPAEEVAPATTGMFEGIEGPPMEEENFIVEPDSELSQRILDNGEQVVSRLDAEKRIGDGERLFGFNEQDDSLVELSLKNLDAFPVDTIIAVRPEVIEEAPAPVTEEVPAPAFQEEEVVAAAPVEEVAPEAPAAPAPKGRTEVVFPKAFEATEVKPYAEVEDNYYRPDQQLKFNQGTYEPVRIIAHPDVIRAMSIGSKLRDNNKRKTVTEQEIDFANGIAKQLGFTTESGKGNAIMLHNAARELAKQNRSNTEERFVVIGEEQGGKKKAAPVTPAPAAPKKEEVQQEPRAAQKIAAISPTNLQVFKGVVTKDPLKPKMQGVYFDKANQKIVATDGMNMVVIDRDVKSDVIIDPKTGQVIKEAFPNYQTVIPTDYTKGVRNVSINDLLGKLDAIIKGDKERIENAFAFITFDGEQVGITPKVLKAGLKALKDLGYETASIEYQNPKKPLLIKTKDGKTLLLTMPTFLREDKAEGAISIGEFALEDIGKPKAEPAPATETKEGKKAEAKGEKVTPTSVVSEKDIVSAKIKEIAEKFKSIESELQGEIDVQDFSDRLRKRYEEIKNEYGEAKANEVLKSESNRADKIIKETKDGILNRLKGEYFKKNGFAPSSIKEFQKGIDSGEYKIDGLPSYKDAVSAKIVEEAVPPVPSFTSEQSSEAATAFDKAKTSKGFDKKHGKGAYKALSDITKNFEDIMDNLSDKIKQDCL